MARLILTTAEGTQAVELRAVNSLGRHPNNTIQLLDKIVSKEHCIIEQRGDHFVLRDLGSLNGTFVNNERVRGEAALRHGDEIALGATRGRFEEGPGVPASSNPAGAGMGARPPAYPPPQGQPQPPQWPVNQAAGGPTPHASNFLASSGQPPMASSGAMPFAGRQPQQAPPAGQPPPGGFPYPPMVQARQVQPPPAGSMPPGSVGAPNTAPGSRQAPGQPGYVGAGGTAPLPLPRQLSQSGGFTVKGGLTGFVPSGPAAGVSINDQERQIGTQIDAIEKGFLPFERIANDMGQLRADYERLRLSHELSHAIGIERDFERLIDKILTSILKFINADRAVLFIKEEGENGVELKPRPKRRDGSNAPITVSSTILDHVVKNRAAVLTHDAAMDFAASKGKSMILNRISSAIVAPLLQHDNEILGVLWLDSETLARFQAKDLELVQTVTNQAARLIEINILGKKVEAEIISRERLSRLLSPNVAERVISGQLDVKPGGQRVDPCTVFNSDIRGFTRMSESTSPEGIVEMLNEYFELMVDTVFKFDGTLDKFMGDGIMALFGAPVQNADDAVRSIECALEMGEVLGQFNRKRLERNEQPLGVGIGIHTGPVVAGYIGSSKALSYTVIGDTANVSARLCSHAASGQIIVSETTLQKIKHLYECAPLPPAKVKGKEQELKIFNVVRRHARVSVPASSPFTSEPTTAAGHS